MQIFISCRRKFIRLPSILELFRKDVVLALSHFTRLMTYMPFCIAFTFSLPRPCVSMFMGRGTKRRFPPYIENSYPEFFDYKSPEMHSKWRYKFISGRSSYWKLESCRNLDKYHFHKILDASWRTWRKSQTFSDSSLHHICESENFRLPFLRKIA